MNYILITEVVKLNLQSRVRRNLRNLDIPRKNYPSTQEHVHRGELSGKPFWKIERIVKLCDCYEKVFLK